MSLKRSKSLKRGPALKRRLKHRLKAGAALKRNAGLSPRREGYAKDNLARNSSLARVGVKMRKKLSGADGYQAFTRAVQRARPNCEIRWEDCTGRSQGVHHVIKRSHGGALLPGPDADRQGQEFVSACNRCNQDIERFPGRARAEGLTKTNPLRLGTSGGIAWRPETGYGKPRPFVDPV